jgi:DnaK suppressor protein
MDVNTNAKKIAGKFSRRRSDLERLLRSLAAQQVSNLDVEFQADPVDQLRENLERDVTVDQLNRQSRLRQAVRYAVDRIKTGDYGRCEECEELIAPQRLNAIPWARFCVKCQSQLESRERSTQNIYEAA